MDVTVAGIAALRKFPQYWNAFEPIVVSELDNVTVFNAMQS
jgi:hypothetical protein